LKFSPNTYRTHSLNKLLTIEFFIVQTSLSYLSVYTQFFLKEKTSSYRRYSIGHFKAIVLGKKDSIWESDQPIKEFFIHSNFQNVLKYFTSLKIQNHVKKKHYYSPTKQ